MSQFASRMTANVGDQDPVWRYLVEKVGHTALVAWALVFLAGIAPVWAAVVAATAYNGIGKGLWLWGRKKAGWIKEDGHSKVELWFELRDSCFDEWTGLLVAVLALVTVAPWYVALAGVLVWATGFLVLDNARWGSPG